MTIPKRQLFCTVPAAILFYIVGRLAGNEKMQLFNGQFLLTTAVTALTFILFIESIELHHAVKPTNPKHIYLLITFIKKENTMLTTIIYLCNCCYRLYNNTEVVL